MRTTVDIDDSVYSELKSQAAEDRTSVKALLSHGARLVLKERKESKQQADTDRGPWPTIGRKNGATIKPVTNDYAFFGYLDEDGE